jgi:hypothetical protein
VTAEADFLADPVEFMKNNIIRPIIHGFSASIQNFKFTHDTAMEVKKGSFHWYNKSVKYYKVEPDPAGTVRAYVLGYKDNEAVGNILGIAPTDPSIMFTYRMDGCSLGFSQTGPTVPAYVSHHNDKANGNIPTNIEGQVVNFSDGSNPNLAYAHKARYMTDSKGAHNRYYKSTTVGVRDAQNVWRFYLQVRKYHGQVGDQNLSFKGVIPINP